MSTGAPLVPSRAEPGANPYEPWAELLQLWERFGQNRDIDFYAGLASEAQRPFVELGVGWGRLAEVVRPDVGLDYAERMLEAAAKRLDGLGVELVKADLLDYTLEQKSRFSYAAMNSFDHITDLATLERIFASVRRNTERGGWFAFDAELHTREELQGSSYNVGLDGCDGEIAIQSSQRLLDPENLIYEVVAFVDWLDEQGFVTARRYFPPLPGRAVSPAQYRRIFEATGWRVAGSWGGFAGEPLDEGGRHQVWLLEAAGD